MAEAQAIYSNYRPIKGHPLCWVFKPKPFELAYVSWGYRWYGDAPANPRAHDGWHYVVLLDGSPWYMVNGERVPAHRGMATIAHPDCVIGHFDRPERRCEILTWVWRAEPTLPALAPTPGGFISLALEPAVLRRLKKVHEQCRTSVARADERSLLELKIARLQMELCLLEGREPKRSADRDFRITLAAEFLHNHLDEPEPVQKLCEYLHISEASLKRLFHEHTGKSPRTFALEWRMRWADEQLRLRGASVKSVAFALGYRHANDFSRAFKRHHGRAASSVLEQNR